MELNKILITGGAGFIGSHIADKLIENNDIVTVDNLSTGNTDNVHKKTKFYLVDIRSEDLLGIFQKERPDIVIHNAAQLNIRVSVDNPLFDADVNILGSINVLNCAKETQVKKIIFASSGGAVYGEQEYFPADELHKTNPTCPYGISKLTVEKYLNYFGIKYIALRYANVYGPRQSYLGEAGVIAIFLNNILHNQSIVINGNGEQTRDYVFIDDVVRANTAAIESDYVGSINIGTGIETSVNQVFTAIKEIHNKELEPLYGKAKSGEQFRSVLSNSLANNILGWQPIIPINKGLKITHDWFKSITN